MLLQPINKMKQISMPLKLIDISHEPQKSNNNSTDTNKKELKRKGRRQCQRTIDIKTAVKYGHTHGI